MNGRFEGDYVVVCAGVQSDRLARGAGASRQPSVVPFFGQYVKLEDSYRSVRNGLVYPVPDPKYPFLDTHEHDPGTRNPSREKRRASAAW